MSLTSPSVANAVIAAVVTQAINQPLSDTIPIALKPSFASVANLNVYRGTFTPANNQLTIFTGVVQAVAPNFFFIICDGQINLTSTNQIPQLGYPWNQMPVMNYAFLSLLNNSQMSISVLTIDGRVGSDFVPMPQGVPVNYTIICGQATIT